MLGTPDSRGGSSPRRSTTNESGLLQVAPHRRRPGKQRWLPVTSCSNRNRLLWAAMFPLSSGGGETITIEKVNQMQKVDKQAARALLAAVEGRGKAPNPETLALAAQFVALGESDAELFNAEVILLDPSDLNLKSWIADTEVTKNRADGSPYTVKARDSYVSRVRQALQKAGVDYTAAFKQTRSGDDVLVLTPVNHRAVKVEEVETDES